MKRFFTLLIIVNILLFTASFFKVKPVLAFDLVIPGTNCGVAGDTEKDKCCVIDLALNSSTPDVGPLNIIKTTLDFFVVGIFPQ